MRGFQQTSVSLGRPQMQFDTRCRRNFRKGYLRPRQAHAQHAVRQQRHLHAVYGRVVGMAAEGGGGDLEWEDAADDWEVLIDEDDDVAGESSEYAAISIEVDHPGAFCTECATQVR
eukprot:352598-Chlamydomonas_euryale.AAC.29